MGTAIWSCTWAPVSRRLQDVPQGTGTEEGNRCVYSLMHLFRKCFLSTYYVPGTLLGSENTVGKQNSSSLPFVSFQSGWGDTHKGFGGLSKSCLFYGGSHVREVKSEWIEGNWTQQVQRSFLQEAWL